MRSIPDSLKAKINQAFQTIHGNNAPKMDIIAQKVTKYLTEGTLLQARTIRTGTSLGPLDICIRRENVNADPTEIIMLYIENGTAKVATLPYVHTPDQNFVYRYTVGPATDVACDFDGRWHKITDRTGIYFDTAIIWALQTFGEPYIARVNAGVLTVQQGNAPLASITLAPDNVTKVSCLRGWKNTYLWNHDQGIIVAYIRSGAVCCRNYAQQPPDQPALWENERTIAEFDTSVHPADNISIFRTNDYRVGILAEINGQMEWVLSERNWANMAIEDHHLSVGITDYTISVLPIVPSSYYHPEHITTGITDYFIAQCTPITPILTGIENPDEHKIILTFSHAITQPRTGHQSAFTVRDSALTPAFFTVLSTSAGSTPNKLVLNMANFASATGNMVVTYNTGVTADNLIPRLTCNNGVGDPCEFAIDSFIQVFTPVLTPPEGYANEHVSVGITDYAIAVHLINHHNPHDNSHVSVGITDYTITVIKVGENPL